MPEDHRMPGRPWREIAQEVASEPDSDKVIELSRELVKSLDKENKQPLQPHALEHDAEYRRRNSA